jgi:glutamate 5-kinase
MINLANYKKIVIKIGTSQLFDPFHTIFQETWFNSLISDIKLQISEGADIYLVASGSIGFPCQHQGLKMHKLKLQEKQIFSSIGITSLLETYNSKCRINGIEGVAPIFMSIDDTENRKKVASVKEIVEEMSSKKLLPIFIHNDILSSAEIRFGDNDRFAAKVAHFMNADLLILFSRVDGLYASDPTKNSNPKFVREVYEINNDIENMAEDSALGTGGMSVKINAVKMAVHSDCDCVIMNGSLVHPLKKLKENVKSTVFWHKKESKMRYILE